MWPWINAVQRKAFGWEVSSNSLRAWSSAPKLAYNLRTLLRKTSEKKIEPSMRRRAWMDFKVLRLWQLWRRDEMGLFIHLMARTKELN